LKLWLNEDYGPVDSIEAVVSAAGYFRLGADEAKRVLGEVYTQPGIGNGSRSRHRLV
jgi:serine/threonine-protein kinase HipA